MTDAPAPPSPRARTWPWLSLRGLGAISKSTLTGPDGVSWAPGRIMGFASFIIGQCAFVRITQAMAPKLTTASDCNSYFYGTVGFQIGLGGACIALVLGMAPTDSGGRWWSKDASPPPKI